MAYKTGWYIEGQVSYAQCISPCDAEEFRAGLEEIDVLLGQGQRPLIHTIVDLTRLEESIGLVQMAKAIRGRKPDPRVGWVIMVGEQNKVVRFSASVVRQILQMRQRSFDTLDEALDFLRDIDSGIDWSRADNSVFDHLTAKVPSISR